MARYISGFEAVATGTSKKTLLQLGTSAGNRLIITELGLSFDGSSAATPIKVRITRQSTAGTASAGTISKCDPSDVAAETASQITYTAEPTDTDQLRYWYTSPTSGLILQFPLGRELKFAASSFVGLCVVAPSSVNASGYLEWEEV